MKSVKTKVLSVTIVILLVSLAIVSAVFSISSIKSTENTLEAVLKETTKVGALNAGHSIIAEKNVMIEMGMNPILTDEEIGVETKRAFLSGAASDYGYMSIDIVDRNGLNSSRENLRNEEFFNRSFTGEAYISSPIVNANDAHIIVSAPLHRDGNRQSEVVGVIYGVKDAQFISDISSEVLVGETGYGYIANGDGTTIGDIEYENVLGQENSIEDAKTDPELLSLAALEQRATEGQAGFEIVKYEGDTYFFVTNPIEQTDNWYFGILITYEEVMAEPLFAMKMGIAISIAAIIIASIIMWIFSTRLIKPISEIEEVISKVATGDFAVDVTYESKDEIGAMANSVRNMLETNNTIMGDIGRLLSEMAEGNFNTAPQAQYIGNFIMIENHISLLLKSLNTTLKEIQLSSDYVAAGANDVSRGAQSLSQSTTEQSTTLDDLTRAIDQITEHVNHTAENTQISSRLAKEAGEDMESSNQSMEQMLGAMKEIHDKSLEIEKIIKTIDDIAFQTNILALNAAVEAARAGELGKGFAVVADEVRSLAQKSAEAANNTTELIQGTMIAVNQGNQISQETAEYLTEVVKKFNTVHEKIEQISEDSKAQVDSITQIKVGIDQMGSVVQMNSATSQESAAASEELSAQAAMLKELTDNFKLQETRGRISVEEESVKEEKVDLPELTLTDGIGGKY